jgi:hypothetical protein
MDGEMITTRVSYLACQLWVLGLVPTLTSEYVVMILSMVSANANAETRFILVPVMGPYVQHSVHVHCINSHRWCS